MVPPPVHAELVEAQTPNSELSYLLHISPQPTSCSGSKCLSYRNIYKSRTKSFYSRQLSYQGIILSHLSGSKSERDGYYSWQCLRNGCNSQAYGSKKHKNRVFTPHQTNQKDNKAYHQNSNCQPLTKAGHSLLKRGLDLLLFR